MEFAGYLTIEASNQGVIDGSSQRKSRQNLINLFAFSHEVKLPFQSHRNIGNGPVVHQPVTVTKEVDKSTPKLYQALAEKELLPQVTMEWFRFNEQGEEQLYYKTLLTNAFIVSVSPNTPEIGKDEFEYLRFMETVTFAYEGITWSWGPDGDIAYQTNWRGDS